MTAAERILSKSLAGSSISSATWTRVQAGLRDRAFFSAAVENARILHDLRAACAAMADGRLSASEMRRDARKMLERLGYDAGDREGTIRDLRTRKRLDLIADVNVRQARGWAQHVEATGEGALRAFPAQELVRVTPRRVPRDWKERWRAAGGTLLDGGRMVALKTAPVWSAISRFGTPYPPFDFNSGMGVRDVARSEAVKLGVLDPDAPPQKATPQGFNDSLTAVVPFGHADSEEAKWLKDTFGDQIVIQHGGTVEWQGGLIQGVVDGTATKAKLGHTTRATAEMIAAVLSPKDAESLSRMNPSFTRSVFEQHAGKHFADNEKDPRNIGLERGDYELMPSVWRSPDRVHATQYPHVSVFELEALDGGHLQLAVHAYEGFLSYYKTKQPLGGSSENAL